MIYSVKRWGWMVNLVFWSILGIYFALLSICFFYNFFFLNFQCASIIKYLMVCNLKDYQGYRSAINCLHCLWPRIAILSTWLAPLAVFKGCISTKPCIHPNLNESVFKKGWLFRREQKSLDKKRQVLLRGARLIKVQ